MINFFNQKKVQNVEIEEKFKWISKIDEQKKELINQDIKIRFDEIEKINNFFSMPNGKNHLQKLYNDMVSSGFPEISSKLEVELLKEIFNQKTINDIFYNPSIGPNKSKLKKDYNKIVINKEYGFISAPKGLIFIVGSSNTILPVITSIILSYVCGNVTIAQLSKLHIKFIDFFLKGLPFKGCDYIHLTNLDRNNSNDLEYLNKLIINLPLNVLNVWGGEESNSFYYKMLSENNHRPSILNMEPLTGIVVIQKSYIEKHTEKVSKELAEAISIMGQQLCSSPTEGYILNDTKVFSEENFFENFITNLEKFYTPSSDGDFEYIKLDRVLSYLVDNGSKVYNSKIYGNKISIVKSKGLSAFNKINSDLSLSIHQRRSFLELIEVENFEEIYKLSKSIAHKETHKEVKNIQTILTFGDKEFTRKVFKLARLIGAFRVVDYKYILNRYPMEPLDGKHLINEFTYQIGIVGSPVSSM